MKDIYKFNAKFVCGYKETSFGYYTLDLEHPGYYEGNSLVIEKDNKEVYECLQTNNFAQVVASPEWFERHGIEASKSQLVTMKSGQEIGSKLYKDYNIELVTEANFADYFEIVKYSQIHDYSELYNPPKFDTGDLDIDRYVIYHGETPIGSLDVYDKCVIENVYLHSDYRKQGIMRNYINYIARSQEIYLLCYDDTVEFYTKCGFTVVDSFDIYSEIILNKPDLINEICKIGNQ
ncbi:GNAT family N-acetyltransferase [Mollicutes bacterium LVI A0039]|nr:GNAT family N-acetyltransferase [Mollicutes bacterium LVI A0039]